MTQRQLIVVIHREMRGLISRGKRPTVSPRERSFSRGRVRRSGEREPRERCKMENEACRTRT